MGINFAYERKKFSETQQKLRKEYEAAGMTEEQILEMYEYDLHQFTEILPTNVIRSVWTFLKSLTWRKRDTTLYCINLLMLWLYVSNRLRMLNSGGLTRLRTQT